jgi:hypothetical protein
MTERGRAGEPEVGSLPPATGYRRRGRLSRAGVRFGQDAQPIPFWRIAGGYSVFLIIAAVALFPVVTIWLTGFKTSTMSGGSSGAG